MRTRSKIFRLLSISTIGVALLSPTIGAAQTTPAASDQFVIGQTSDGTLYLFTPAGRYNVTPQPVTDDMVALFPDLGQVNGRLPPVPAPTPTIVSTVTPVTPSSVLPTATATIQAITLSGRQTMLSQSFSLQGGNYAVTWKAWPLPVNGYAEDCVYSARLKPIDAQVTLASGDSLGRGQVSHGLSTAVSGVTGETTLSNIPAGQYAVQSNSGCVWSVTLARLS